jgi:aquaporin Z
MGPVAALREHWPEYLIESWALGTFMVSAGIVATLLGSPGSPIHAAIASDELRRVVGGIAMGLTAIALIHSPWGQRSGAHMNPAVTLTFARLGKIKRWDAAFYVLAQFAGGLAGVLLLAALIGESFTSAPVRYAATLPGTRGPQIAFVAELLISAGMMTTILAVSNSARLAKFTGICAGTLVALYISLEEPLSGMSMNPARSFASAAPGMLWQHLWIYFTAPVLGMLIGSFAYGALAQRRYQACAKLLHPADVRCIHCGQRGKIP